MPSVLSVVDPSLHIPRVTADQMREVDRLAVEEFGILLVQMMENAGRCLAQLARDRFLDGNPRGREVLVLAGSGGNGGGGLVAARRLHGWGSSVRVYSAQPRGPRAEVGPGLPDAHTPAEVLRLQRDILDRMSVPIEYGTLAGELPEADLIIDALVGYSLRGAPSGTVAALVRAAQAHPAPVLALDVPSGVDSTTGEAHDPAVRAEATLTLALPKTGLDKPGARPYIGELYLADIAIPPSLYAEPSLGLHVGPIFANADILRLR